MAYVKNLCNSKNMFVFSHKTSLHANVQCVYTVNATCQIVSAKAVVRADF